MLIEGQFLGHKITSLTVKVTLTLRNDYSPGPRSSCRPNYYVCSKHFVCFYSQGPKVIPQSLLSTPMGVDYVVIGFDMEVQPLVTHNAA